MEEWRNIKGYEGLYEVSNQGRIRSLVRKVTYKDGRVYFYKSKVLKPSKDRYGYYFVNLCKEGKRTPKSIHRLIAEAFIPNPENKRDIDHINTIRTDNRIENLRWATRSENCLNPITNERQKNSQHSTPVAQYSLEGELIAVYRSIKEAARQTGCSHGNIYNCCNGGFYYKGKWINVKQCKGYIWKYHQI